MDFTTRFELPLLAAGQAQKEIAHNEALTLIDTLLHPVVVSSGVNEPPSAPLPGQSWIVGPQPSGAWDGKSDHLASWTDGGWRFVAPRPGMSMAVADAGLRAIWHRSAWQLGIVNAAEIVVDGDRVVGARQAAIDLPSAGAVVDVEAREALDAVLMALRAHGLIAA